MSERKRHWMIQLQRENRNRPVTYAQDDQGDELRDEKGIVPRAQFRGQERFDKRLKKREASRSTRQRRLMARFLTVELAVHRLKRDGHDPVLHPENPYVTLSLRRKLRKQGKGKILTKGTTGRIVVPGRPNEADKSKGRVEKLKDQASRIIVPGRRSA